MALFEGHMPAVDDEKSVKAARAMDEDEDEDEEEEVEENTTSFKGREMGSNVFEDIEYSELLGGFGSIDGYFLEDM